MKKVRGFTLIELLFCVAILAILVAVFLPMFVKSANKKLTERAQEFAKNPPIEDNLLFSNKDGRVEMYTGNLDMLGISFSRTKTGYDAMICGRMSERMKDIVLIVWKTTGEVILYPDRKKLGDNVYLWKVVYLPKVNIEKIDVPNDSRSPTKG